VLKGVLSHSLAAANANVNDDAPKIAVDGICRGRGSRSGIWLFGWCIQNLSDQPIKLLAARLPHGRFRSHSDIGFNPPLEMGIGERAQIETAVFCDEPPGSVIENAFLILSAEWEKQDRRIFVRLRVTVNEQGQPESLTELVTAQKVGFSGIS
jgi:hypothetical protein